MIATKINYFSKVSCNNKEKTNMQTEHFKLKIILKKLSSIILCTAMLFTITACTPTASPNGTTLPDITEKAEQTSSVKLPEYENEIVLLNDIGEYSIVYPSEYTDYMKQDVKFLQKVIKNVTGANLNIVSDLENTNSKEIIIASSKRKNGIEEAIENFPDELDYVIGVRKGNIILGGKNFYADIKAIYDFINNVLGYDDIEETKSPPQTSISGLTYKLYTRPNFLITAHNGAVSNISGKKVIRDMRDANFNVLQLDTNWHNNDEILEAAKWCSRYELLLMVGNPAVSDILMDCPAVFSTLEIDEPGPERFENVMQNVDSYIEKYGEKGWLPFVNMGPVVWNIDPIIEWEGYFDNIPMISFDVYPQHSLEYTYKWDMDALGCYERLSYLSRKTKKDLWVYIESYNIKNRNENTSKMFRWQGYMALSFGAKNILYFQYGDASKNYTAEGDWSYGSLINWDHSKNNAWFDAQKFNNELIELAPIYNQYDAKGACTLNAPPDEPWLNYNSSYPNAKNIVTEYICEDKNNNDAYLLGFFDKKENNNAHAFTIVNISDLNDEPYESDESKYVKFKISSDKVTFYRNGKAQNVEKTDDGYYNVNMANGFCWFVTVD